MDRQRIAWLALILSSVGALFLIINALVQTGVHWQIDFPFGSNLGSLLSGLLALPTVLLLWSALSLQARSFNQNEIDGRFFKLLEFHRSNVQNMTLTVDEDGFDAKGARVFERVHDEIGYALSFVREIVKDANLSVEGILSESAQERLRNSPIIRERKIDLMELSVLNISYLIVFYGLRLEGRGPLESALRKSSPDALVNDLISFLEIHIDANKQTPSRFFYEGKQHVLSSYFRQFYQAVTYIDSNRFLSPKQKYAFIKTYRAQLNNYEQAVFFFNSISDVGRTWEFSPPADKPEQRLVTTYHLIKNLPPGFAHGINVPAYYPDVHYEVR